MANRRWARVCLGSWQPVTHTCLATDWCGWLFLVISQPCVRVHRVYTNGSIFVLPKSPFGPIPVFPNVGVQVPTCTVVISNLPSWSVSLLPAASPSLQGLFSLHFSPCMNSHIGVMTLDSVPSLLSFHLLVLLFISLTF